MDLLAVNNLTVWYETLFGDIRALDHLTLTVQSGTVTCLLGRNGAGKTTLLNTISGVVTDYDGKITQGDIHFAGKSLIKWTPAVIVSSGISHAPQGRHIFHTLSVKDNLKLGAYVKRHQKHAHRILREQMAAIYALFPVLGAKSSHRAGHLSGGEQQMLAIARALMSSPKLLILDEPFLGLAPGIINQILEGITTLKHQGLSLLLAEQNASAALSVADTGLVMEEGFIVAGGDPKTLQTRPKVKELFFGEM